MLDLQLPVKINCFKIPASAGLIYLVKFHVKMLQIRPSQPSGQTRSPGFTVQQHELLSDCCIYLSVMLFYREITTQRLPNVKLKI